MSTPKKDGASAAATKSLQNVDTKNGSEKAAQNLNPKVEPKQEEKREPVVQPAPEVPTGKPSVDQILKRLPILNSLKEKLVTLETRNDQLLNAIARRTGEGETLTISFGSDEPIIVTNPTGVVKCLNLLVGENETLIGKAKAEIESFTF